MKRKIIRNLTAFATVMAFTGCLFSQTSVYDVIEGSDDHTSLKAAIDEAGLDGALQDLNAEYTVFAPDNNAFDNLAAALETDINGLLANPDLQDILLYHVLGAEVNSTAISNGQIVTPLNNANTLKLTVTNNNVFVNQATVNAADIGADNGIVHSLDAVVLYNETVVDVALDNGFTILRDALIETFLIPALSDPFGEFTVFAPSDQAFSDALDALNISAQDLLENPGLTDILLYHVLGAAVESGDITNGDLATPLNANNTIKLTVTSTDAVFANQAQVELADVLADNGVVHAIDAVIFDLETVVDVAIDNGFTVLTDAVIAAELLPALTNPFAKLTVFAPTDEAFADLLDEMGITAGELLDNPDLANILLYHVVGAEVLSTELTDGPVTTLSGADVIVDLTSGVFINNSEVILADVSADNGVVHVIDRVLLESYLSTDDIKANSKMISTYPNPATDVIKFNNLNQGAFTVVSLTGAEVLSGSVSSSSIDISKLEKGTYIINIKNDNGVYQSRFVKI